ncbi:MAG: lactate racemase domain-containing protein [Verrucomicrobiota bacterium]|nr:lactate racemase domain-containing protein [Verrucomicrobiota bacterium]
MSILVQKGGEKIVVTDKDLKILLENMLEAIPEVLNKVLIVPPDITRLNSHAGKITEILYELLTPQSHVDIIPALGTHVPMNDNELRSMFGEKIPLNCFIKHNWRKDVVKKGTVSGKLLHEWSEGKVNYDVDVEVNKILFDNYDVILSIGQIVPHEVVGMANYTKNIMVGIGGADTINKSHFLGAVYNMERIMGQARNPVRKLFDYGLHTFLSDLPIYYLHTVMQRDNETEKMLMRGFYAGSGDEVFLKPCKLCKKVNINILDDSLQKVIVYLDPEEFKSTWLGNKAVYRTRMAIADGGELIVLAPALKEFGEDPEIDRLIRKYGYNGTKSTLKAVEENADLRGNLSAAAHLIHGSSEGRFKITYCPGNSISEKEIEDVGFNYASLEEMQKKYDPNKLADGYNTMPDGEEIFYISNPALGLWGDKANFI